jgi:hypothetical protein
MAELVAGFVFLPVSLRLSSKHGVLAETATEPVAANGAILTEAQAAMQKERFKQQKAAALISVQAGPAAAITTVAEPADVLAMLHVAMAAQ